jgi:hypothetical protein
MRQRLGRKTCLERGSFCLLALFPTYIIYIVQYYTLDIEKIKVKIAVFEKFF